MSGIVGALLITFVIVMYRCLRRRKLQKMRYYGGKVCYNGLERFLATWKWSRKQFQKILINAFCDLLHGLFKSFAFCAWKESVFAVFLVLIFPHSDWIRTRKTPNTDTFYVVLCRYKNALEHNFLLASECFCQNPFLLSEDTLTRIFRKIFLNGQLWERYGINLKSKHISKIELIRKPKQDWKFKVENFSSSVSNYRRKILNCYRRKSESNEVHESHATPFALFFHPDNNILSFGYLPTYYSHYPIPYMHLKQGMYSESLRAANIWKIKGFISKKYDSKKE